MCKGTTGTTKISPPDQELEKSKVVTESDKKSTNENAKRILREGTIYGASSLALLIGAVSLTMPHLQSRRDELGCDRLCYGSMMSVRSFLSLIGSALMGRISDQGPNARKWCLYIGSVATFLGMFVAANTNSISGMWWSMIPGALFQQNFNIMKALFSDYSDAMGDRMSPSDRAASVGMLGMAVGLSFMVGPLAGTTVINTYDQANLLGMVFIVASALVSVKLPDPTRTSIDSPAKPSTKKEKKSGILDFLDVKAARTPAAIMFMSIRLCMALAFHCFSTIWSPSLKEKFDFGPSDHGKFMSFIGLTYALSQGFVAKFLLARTGADTSHRARVRMILASCVMLGVGRYVAFQTTSLPLVYCLFGGIVTALGLVNTILTADTSYLAPPEEIGSLFGILAAVESAAGMVGPLLGGSLSLLTEDGVQAPLYTVLLLYVVVFAAVFWGYERLVLSKAGSKVASKRQ